MSKDGKELFDALDALEREKHIPKAYMLEKIEAALVSAIKKEYNTTSIRVAFDAEKMDMRVFLQKEVVAVVEDPESQISLEEAKAISKRYTIGKMVETEVKTKNFRRLSAAAAKSVIIQGIREGERRALQEAYENQCDKIITAVVAKIDRENGTVVLETGTSLAALPVSEQLPGETFNIGDKVKVYVTEVNSETRGPLVRLSRTNPGLVRRMFELEIPEIANGTVVIKSIAREAGSRTKIAVYSAEPDVDPVGSCIGARGSRINAIVDELRGEKVDVVKYSEDYEEYVKAALSPATVMAAIPVEERSFRVVVAADQLSLAIGKEGQNARLAARLTGCKIDIKTEF